MCGPTSVSIGLGVGGWSGRLCCCCCCCLDLWGLVPFSAGCCCCSGTLLFGLGFTVVSWRCCFRGDGLVVHRLLHVAWTK